MLDYLSRLSQSEKKWTVLLSGWLFVQLIFCLIGERPIQLADYTVSPARKVYFDDELWPLQTQNLDYYNFPELLIYGILPLALLFIYIWLKRQN